MPNENTVFTPSSILFRPHHKNPKGQVFVVEAPGTAPGSEWLITQVIYRHSRRTDTHKIGRNGGNLKTKSRINRVSVLFLVAYLTAIIGTGFLVPAGDDW